MENYTDICQVVPPTVASQPSEPEPIDDQSCSSDHDMDFNIDTDSRCNDADESDHKEDENESVNKDVTRKHLYAIVKTSTETMWRLTDGNREL